MNKILMMAAVATLLSACVAAPNYAGNADISAEAAAERRARVRAIDNEDYAIERSRRKDAIEDYGDMRMKEAEAINKAHENISKQQINIIH